jgi:DnaJ-class molecular chaperone
MRTFYECLGVAETADTRSIRKAFVKLSRKCHPEVNPGDPAEARRYREYSLAHEVLADPQGRAEYDRLGHEEFLRLHPEAGGALRGADARGTRREQGPPSGPAGEDIRILVTLNIIEAARGAEIHRDVPRKLSCPSCAGRREAGRQCDQCGGSGLVERTDRVRLRIPAGVATGSEIRRRGLGHAGPPGGRPGDLIVITRIEGRPDLERKGDNLYGSMHLAAWEAALGTVGTVSTIDGPLQVAVPPGSQPGQKIRLVGRGIPNLKSGRRGDQYVELKVALPEPVTPEQAEAYRALARAFGD